MSSSQQDHGRWAGRAESYPLDLLLVASATSRFRDRGRCRLRFGLG